MLYYDSSIFVIQSFMRQLMSISLPNDLKRYVEKAVKEDGYSTTSEFIRDLIRQRKEERIVRELLESEKDMKTGKGKVLTSLKAIR